MRTLFWCHIGFLLALSLAGLARPAPVPETALLDGADAIVLGTVARDERVDADMGGLDGRAAVRVERALRGNVRGEIRVWHQKPAIPPPGVTLADDPGFDLVPGETAIFFLTRHRVDYRLIGGRLGMCDAGEAERYVQAIAAAPVSVVVKAPAGPFYFDRWTPVTCTVANAGAEAVQVTHVRLDGQYYAPRMGPDFVFDLQPLAQEAPPLPAAIPPKGTRTFTFNYRARLPQSWLLFPADSYLLAPVLLRAVAYVAAGDAPLAGARQRQPASPWSDALIGYPPPAP